MSEFMESTGKTVDEAIREALLRMGLRREEVDVTVIQRDRGGLLGIGRRDAVVRVERKSGTRRSSGGSGDQNRGGGRRRGGGSDARGERLDDGQDRGSRRGGRRSSGGRGRQDGDQGGQGGQESRGRDQGGRGRDGGRDGDGERSSRGSRGGRGRGRGRGRRDNETVAAENQNQNQNQSRNESQAQSAPQQARDDGRSRRPESEGGEEGRTRRRRRSRRRRKPSAEVESAVTNPTGDGNVFNDDAQETRQEARTEREQPRSEQPRSEQPRDEQPRRQESPRQERQAQPAAESAPERQEAPAETPVQSEAPAARVESGSALAEGLSAMSRVAPYSADETEPVDGFLEKVATGLMVKSGFPCRVLVKDGEYHQVKMVVDDRSAGVLIGRHGNTVDAVEYLVEKMASHAVGDRVRMNLDINNYRLRRHDSIEERARNAAAEARNTGEPVKMPPMHGRERRLVHLEIEDMDDLVTYTEDGYDGKCVVICREDQVPADQAPSTGPSDQDAAPAAAQVEEQSAVASGNMAASENAPAPDAPRTETAAVITDDADDLDDDEPRRDVD